MWMGYKIQLTKMHTTKGLISETSYLSFLFYPLALRLCSNPHLFDLINILGGSPGLVVMGGDSRFKGRGFESQHWMDIFSHKFVVKIVMFV